MIHQKLFRVFLLLLPSQLAFHFWPDFSYVYGIRVDYLSLAVYLVDILWFVTFFLWFVFLKNKRILFARYKYLGIAFILLALLNIIFSQIPGVSVYRWLKVFLLLALYVYVNYQNIPVSSLRKPFAVSLLFTLALAVTQTISSRSVSGALYFLGERTFDSNTPGIALGNLFGREFLRPYATFPHPNALGGFGLISAFLFLGNKEKTSRLVVMLGISLCILSYSQNAWLSMVCAPLVYILLKKLPTAKLKFVVSSVVASFFLTLGNFASSRLPEEFARRVDLGLVAGKLLALAPILGVGLGTFSALVPTVTASERVMWWLQPVHNSYLLVATEVGMVGLLLFTYFMFVNMNKVNMLAMLAIILTGMFDHYWITLNQTSYLMFLAIGARNLSGKIEK